MLRQNALYKCYRPTKNGYITFCYTFYIVRHRELSPLYPLTFFEIWVNQRWLLNAGINCKSFILIIVFRMFHSYCFRVVFTLIIIFGFLGSFVIIKIRGVPFILLRLRPNTTIFNLVTPLGFNTRLSNCTPKAELKTCKSLISRSECPLFFNNMVYVFLCLEFITPIFTSIDDMFIAGGLFLNSSLSLEKLGRRTRETGISFSWLTLSPGNRAR